MNTVRTTGNAWTSVYIIVLFMITGWAGPAGSTQTEIWETSSFKEFQRGETEHVSLTSTGELVLAPEIEPVFSLSDEELFVWALAEDSKGNLYAGTGEQGKIFKITPEGEVSVFFDSPEIGILSLAIDQTDTVYAGSAPDGLIYKITPEGTPTTLFNTGEHYVWALALDAENVLYAGTGEAGKIFKILPDGTGTTLYDSSQTHIMSLLYDPQGWLYAGTEGEGIIYTIGLDGKAFALYSAEEDEIHALMLDSQHNLYAAAISNTFYPKAQPGGPAEQQPSPKKKSSKKSSIYRISPDGTVTKILELSEALIYAMLAETDERWVVGTDKNGQLYRVLSDGEYQQVLALETGNILSLLKNAAGQIYIGTGDTGTIYRLSAQPAEEGVYRSAVHDGKNIATWGKIFWRGTTNQVTLLTRTGNTPIPDETWSDWSSELLNHVGDLIPNPPARFIQWKAHFTRPQDGPPPALQKVSVAYLPNNIAPEISQIAIYYAGQEGQQPRRPTSSRNNSSQSSTNRQSQRNSNDTDKQPDPPKYIPTRHVAIVWKAHDPNNEPLRYSVALRGATETRWNMIEEELESTTYLLDTLTLPDGEYYVKVTATDEPNNPPKNTLKTEKVSELFVIDNTAPEISIALNQKQGQQGMLVTVIAQDDLSRIQQAEYAIDGGEWIAIFPDDQVTDSRDEKYSIPLTEMEPGQHVLMFKAADRYNNVGLAKFGFPPQSANGNNTEQQQPPAQETPQQ